MKSIPFNVARFLTSALKTEELPETNLCEIAIAGRSNVGKSSLINHLLRSKKVAKVSSKPGKTERINYFLIDDRLFLIDLPGYGYAKTSKALQKKWGFWVDKYLQERELRLILFLLDARREWTTEDYRFLKWALHKQIPLILVLTKVDRLKQGEKDRTCKRLASKQILHRFSFILYSIKEGKCREELIYKINQVLWG